MNHVNVMMALVRRELWEHRVLLVAPAALCVMYVLLCILAGANFSIAWVHFEGPGLMDSPRHPAYFAFLAVIFTGMLYVLTAIVAVFYLADCLYSERKDRSILFWKSLPVSDAATVTSKLLVALIVVPLAVFVLAFVANLLAYLSFVIQFPPLEENPNLPELPRGELLKVSGVLLADVFVLALWYSPIAAFQLVVSAWAKRNAVVWTFLPFAAVILAERLFFNTWHIGKLLLHRLSGGEDTTGSYGIGTGLEGPAAAINALPLLMRMEMWVGVAIAVALVLLAIRIRRHSDDS